jgi:AcrR family transcriptional regulator
VARPSRWNEIVDVAAELFRKKGFVATSLEDIARELGMYKGSLYHYIDSKEDLLFAVVREPAEQILADLREFADLDLPPAEKIRRMMRSHVSVLESNFTYASVYLEEVAGKHRSEEWSAMDREYVNSIVSVVDDGKRSGDFASAIDARITTLALIGSLNWLIHWYHPDGQLKGAEIADKFCDLFLSGLLSRSPAPKPS